MIPKASGKVRRLGIATAPDRVVQAVLKLVLEPIFEADFKPCSYGFRPRRRAQDAIAEIHYLGTPARNYEWVFEADITACFDEISHSALLERMRDRVGDKRVLGLVKAFLTAGILSEDGVNRNTITGTPQGGILSPCLANIALSVLDEHFTRKWEALGPDWKRAKLATPGVPALQHRPLCGRLRGDGRWHPRARRSALGRGQRGARSDRLAPVGREDEGLPHRRGVRLPRMAHPAAILARSRPARQAVYTYPSKKALASVIGQGQIAHPPQQASNARRPAAAAQPGAAGLVQLLPTRRVRAHVQLPGPLRVVASGLVAAQTTQRAELGHPQPPPTSQDGRSATADVKMFRPQQGRDRSLPLPGRTNPDTMGERSA